jgi:hypothetical protein
VGLQRDPFFQRPTTGAFYTKHSKTLLEGVGDDGERLRFLIRIFDAQSRRDREEQRLVQMFRDDIDPFSKYSQ